MKPYRTLRIASMCFKKASHKQSRYTKIHDLSMLLIQPSKRHSEIGSMLSQYLLLITRPKTVLSVSLFVVVLVPVLIFSIPLGMIFWTRGENGGSVSRMLI